MLQNSVDVVSHAHILQSMPWSYNKYTVSRTLIHCVTTPPQFSTIRECVSLKESIKIIPDSSEWHNNAQCEVGRVSEVGPVGSSVWYGLQ